ncbi:MAG: hypothetical protein WCJ93_03945 [Methanomicrobiales archaeon]
MYGTKSLLVPALYPATVEDNGVIAGFLIEGPGIVVMNCLGAYPVGMPVKVVDGTSVFTPTFTTDDATVEGPILTLSVMTSPNGISTGQITITLHCMT